MPKSTSLKNCLPRLAAVLLLGLFTVAGFAEESRPPWKVAIVRTAAPIHIEMEQGFKDGLVKLGYVEGRNLTYLPTVVVNPRIEDFAETAKLVQRIRETDKPDLFATIGTQASIPAWQVLGPTGKIAFAYSGQMLPDATYAKYLRVASPIANWQVIFIDYFDYAQNNTSLRLLIDKLRQFNPDLVFGWSALDMLGDDCRAFKELLDQLRKPLITRISEGVDEGAIGGVFTDDQKLGEQQARMIDRIIKGEKPGDIPPLEPTAYLIELNLKKAQELGIQFDQKIIESASRVIR